MSHTAGAGDVDAGRAWRMVRRPSDMNEYAQQIREYRNQDKGKAYGKVFVKGMWRCTSEKVPYLCVCA